MALDLEQAEEFIHTGRDGQLLRGDVHDSALQKDLPEPAPNLGPVCLHLALGLNFLSPEVGASRSGVCAELPFE